MSSIAESIKVPFQILAEESLSDGFIDTPSLKGSIGALFLNKLKVAAGEGIKEDSHEFTKWHHSPFSTDHLLNKNSSSSLFLLTHTVRRL